MKTKEEIIKEYEIFDNVPESETINFEDLIKEEYE